MVNNASLESQFFIDTATSSIPRIVQVAGELSPLYTTASDILIDIEAHRANLGRDVERRLSRKWLAKWFSNLVYSFGDTLSDADVRAMSRADNAVRLSKTFVTQRQKVLKGLEADVGEFMDQFLPFAARGLLSVEELTSKCMDKIVRIQSRVTSL